MTGTKPDYTGIRKKKYYTALSEEVNWRRLCATDKTDQTLLLLLLLMAACQMAELISQSKERCDVVQTLVMNVSEGFVLKVCFVCMFTNIGFE